MGWLSNTVPVLLAVAVGCGGTVERRADGTGGPTSGGTGATATDGGLFSDGGGPAGSGGAFGGDGGTTSSYVDPGCPDVPPPTPIHECDPFADVGECDFGERCTPYVQYPEDTCQSEVFGTICSLEGPGVQGDDCTDTSCAAQHVCVTTGQGNQCVHICRLDAPDDCAPGLLCQPLDVDGFYICF
jgi:hypothetical protein